MAVQLVGGAFLSASLQVLFNRLASSEVLNFIRGQKLSDSVLSKFKIKLLIVDEVLDHAEVKQFRWESNSGWCTQRMLSMMRETCWTRLLPKLCDVRWMLLTPRLA